MIVVSDKPPATQGWLWGNKESSFLPLGRVHLFAGASGSGKTTLLFQILKAALNHQQFLDINTRWLPTLYIAFDRLNDEQEETMQRVGLPTSAVPHYCIEVPMYDRNKETDTRLSDVLVYATTQLMPGVKVIIIDGIYMLAPHGEINNYVKMGIWLQKASILARSMDVTVLGVIHSAKQREGNRIIDPRYSGIGSVAGGGFSSTQIVVEQPQVEGAPERRVVNVYPRNSKVEKFDMKLDDNGLLQPYTEMKGASLPAGLAGAL